MERVRIEVGPHVAGDVTWTHVVPVGPVDVATAPDLDGALVRAQVDVGHRVALDLGRVVVCDALGLGVVLAAHVRAGRRGGQLAVVCPPGRVRALLAESGLDRLVPVVAALADLPRTVASGVSRLAGHDERM
ncbi:MAG: STAS domain-containing protein [Actinomycetes bacterium]